MDTPITIKKGLDIKLAGRPRPEVSEALQVRQIGLCVTEYPGIKPRLCVKEGDTVKRGSALFYDKKNERFKVRSPAAGTVRSTVFGPRRALERIVIDLAQTESSESFPRYSEDEITKLPREQLLNHLQDTGLIALIRQRPFSKIANAAVTPKSIFVNGMNTAPFQPDPNVAIQGHEKYFQAGLNALKPLTTGVVHLCVGDDLVSSSSAMARMKNVERHTFRGPHPSGNTSVHIAHIDPIRPGDTVWTVKAVDLVLIGQLLLDGQMPASKVIALGGPGVADGAQMHYRVRIGTPLKDFLEGRRAAGEQRIVSGDVLTGTEVPTEGFLRFMDSGLTLLPEDRSRHFLGWLAPGLTLFSDSRTFLSRWFNRRSEWALATNQHGSPRAMVLTGLYDRYMPMNIMVDFLVRAVLAHDTEEAVKLGILETDPEDFALCAFACPSKTDLMGIIRQGLDEIEREGF